MNHYGYLDHTLTIQPPIQPSGDSRPARPRRRDVVENDEYAAFVRRIVRAYVLRISKGDVEALRGIVELTDLIEEATADAVLALRAYGYSWAEIGQRLGISRQAVREWRHGPDMAPLTLTASRIEQLLEEVRALR